MRCSGLVVPLDAQLTDRSTPARPEPPARHHPRALADSRNRSARRRPLLSDEAVEPGDRFGHAFMIRADYRTQILRVEFGRERSRADEVNVTVSWPLSASSCRVDSVADRAQQLAAIAEQYTEVFKMLVREVGKDAEVQCDFRQNAQRTWTCRVP